MKEALAIGTVCVLIEFYLKWGEIAGYSACGARNMSKYGMCVMPCSSNSDDILKFGPSFLSTALPWNDYFLWTMTISALYSCLSAWVVLIFTPSLIVVVYLVKTGVCRVRSPKLALLQLALMLSNRFWHIFDTRLLVDFKLTYDPFAIPASFLVPFYVLVMVLDSMYWSSLSPVFEYGDDLDAPLVEGNDGFRLQTVAMTLQSLGGSPDLKHFHHSMIQTKNQIAKSQNSVIRGTCGLLEDVAIKSILCENMEPRDLQECCYEILVAEMLQVTEGSFIVKHHGFSVSPPYLHVIMELCDMSLQELLYRPYSDRVMADTPIDSPIERCRYAQELAMGVQFMHDRNVIHRDLKPQNVLLKRFDNRLHVKLCDFGEASLIDCTGAYETEDPVPPCSNPNLLLILIPTLMRGPVSPWHARLGCP